LIEISRFMLTDEENLFYDKYDANRWSITFYIFFKHEQIWSFMLIYRQHFRFFL